MVQAGPARVPLGARLSLREKFIVMAALMTGMFLFALDQSIVATAVPHIVADLGGFTLLPWVFTIYVLTSTIVIPPIGDRKSTRLNSSHSQQSRMPSSA